MIHCNSLFLRPCWKENLMARMFSPSCTSRLKISLSLLGSIRSWVRVISTPSISKMSTVTVHSLPDNDSMTISFIHEGKHRHMERAKDEILEKSLKRIFLSIQNSKKKSKKDKKETVNVRQEEDQAVSLWFGNEMVSGVLPNEVAWKDGSFLKLGDRDLPVEVNPPRVISLSLPSHIMADFPIFPVVEVQFATIESCVFSWYRSLNPIDDSASASPLKPSEYQWQEVGSSFFYKPSLSDIGCYLKLVCTAASQERISSVSTEAISLARVSAGPGLCPFENRQLYTSKKLGKGHLRVVSYNILADVYSREPFALNVLYPYCSMYAITIGYRQQLLLKELSGYNADILCLQECGTKIFHDFLERAMSMLGYQGFLKCKPGVPEGEAIFFNQEKLEFVRSHDIAMKDALLQDPINEGILDHISSIPALLETLTKRNSVAQITILKDKEQNKLLCVVNTHLYYKPKSPHVRLIQASIILNEVKKVISLVISNQGQESDPEGLPKKQLTNLENVALIFCGDLNSDPRSGLIELLSTGVVDNGHPDWTINEDQDEHCQTMTVSHQFDFTNASGFPPYTNFTLGYKGTLDYIFCEKIHFEVQAVIPVPPEDELLQHCALPSVVMPSDHIAVVCDLRWK